MQTGLPYHINPSAPDADAALTPPFPGNIYYEE